MNDAQKPVYNVNDNIPKGMLILTVLQHFLSCAVYMTYPVIIVSAIGGSASLTSYVISATLIGCGISTIIQYFSKVGSGHIMPMIPNSSYLPASLLAVVSGGMPLLYGMIIVSGFFEMLLSRFTKFFRVIFPSEVTGVVLFLLGIAIVPFAFPMFFGSTDGSALDAASTLVGAVTLVTIIVLNAIPKKIFGFYSVLFGIAAGFIASVLLGVFTPPSESELSGLSIFAIPNPLEYVSFEFDPALLIPFSIAVICIALKTLANIHLMNAYTNEFNRKNVRKGLFSEGLGISLTGLFGGVGIGSSLSAGGIVIATGVASRKIGLGLGVLMIVCGFFPVIGLVFHIIPKPILGAVLLYAVALVMMSGITSISSRMLDQRRIFVVIFPILIGISSAVCPYLYTSLAPVIQLFFASPLTSGAFSVLILGLLFKIGIHKKKTLDLTKDKNILGFLLTCGKLWCLDKSQTVSIAHHLSSLAADDSAVSLVLTFNEMSAKLNAEIVFDKDASVPTPTRRFSYFVTLSTKENVLHAEYLLI